jgi:hypothetical protein
MGITNTHTHTPTRTYNIHTYIHTHIYTVEPRFTNKFSEQKPSRMTNGVSDYEHESWQERQAESIAAGVSVAG